jgi:hypothetical protein
MKHLFLFFIFFFPAYSSMADVYCKSCSIKITGQYLLDSHKRAFCSKKCFSSVLPDCSVCKKKISGKYQKAGNKLICSERCLLAILPKCSLCKVPSKKRFKIDALGYCENCNNRPHCFSCNHPFAEGVKIPDGRAFCSQCKKVAIFDLKTAKEVYRSVHKDHEKISGVKALKIPPVLLVGLNEMKKHHPAKNAVGLSLRGYYEEVKKESTVMQGKKVVSRNIKKIKENIYLVDGVNKEDMMVTAVHELTHDWLSDYCPGIKVAPLWIEEGACQYLAYIYCKAKGFQKNAARIAGASDQVYGKGFKFYLKTFGENNWAGALRWMKKQGYLEKPAFGVQRKHSH